MKKVFTLLFTLSCVSAHAQYPYHYILSFEKDDTLCHKVIILDTTHSNNMWQIGKPNKSVFKTGYDDSSALVTDTLKPYPIIDTSIFYIKVPLGVSSYPVPPGSLIDCPLQGLYFDYQLDIDTDEIAQIEMSVDSGHTWADVWGLSVPDGFQPSLDTNIVSSLGNKWTAFSLEEPLSSLYRTEDTVLFRFTFISDSVDTHKDGWMIDNLSIDYYTEDIPQLARNNNLINIYPNPSGGNFCVRSQQPFPRGATLAIYNILGQGVYQTSNIPVNGIFDLPLPSGMYVLKYTTDKEYAVKQLIITR